MCGTGIFPIVPSKTNHPRRNPIPYKYVENFPWFASHMNEQTNKKQINRQQHNKQKNKTTNTRDMQQKNTRSLAGTEWTFLISIRTFLKICQPL